MQKSNLDYFGTEELAAHICGVYEEYENSDLDSSVIEEALYDKFNIGFEEFHKIVEHLTPLIRTSKSELTGNNYRGFVVDGCYIVKERVK